jgi:hypothetical protein
MRPLPSWCVLASFLRDNTVVSVSCLCLVVRVATWDLVVSRKMVRTSIAQVQCLFLVFQSTASFWGVLFEIQYKVVGEDFSSLKTPVPLVAKTKNSRKQQSDDLNVLEYESVYQ